MDNIFMHIDVNNAFLSWTAVDLLNKGYKIDIRNIESIIGGDETQRRGIVLAKSMVAKSKGVKTAETIRDAKRKCNNLKIFPPNHKLYEEMSNKLFNLISNYTPDIEKLSVDECFIDYTKVRNLYGDPIKFAYKLKNEIKNILGFTVNIGIANNKLCAKMASDFLKPDRVHTLFKEEVKLKMYPLPIEELYGVGRSSSKKLRELNINTVGDLANANPKILYKYFKNQTEKLINSAKGIDDSIIVSKKQECECISNSTTTSYNLNSLEEIYKFLYPLVENVSMTLRKNNKYSSLVSVMLKDKNFKTSSHQRKLKNPTSNTDAIYNISKELVKELWNEEGIRLVGVSLGKLSNFQTHQISLFEDVKIVENNNELDKVVDKLKNIYGNNIIKKASQIKK
ncbi:MAG: DNA polymerase IV [Bacilli bacterium]|nr:DNA polymerase IV [Bacilli bacterium]